MNDLRERIMRREELLASRKLRLVRVAFEIWTGFLKGKLRPPAWSSAPEDLEVVNVWRGRFIPERLDLEILVWSESFEAVPDEQEIPDFVVGFHTLRPLEPLGDEETEALKVD